MTHANAHTYQMQAGRLSGLLTEEAFARVPERDKRIGNGVSASKPQGLTGVPSSEELTAKQQGHGHSQRFSVPKMS